MQTLSTQIRRTRWYYVKQRVKRHIYVKRTTCAGVWAPFLVGDYSMSTLFGWRLWHTNTVMLMCIKLQDDYRNVTHHIRCIIFPSQTDFEHSYIHLFKNTMSRFYESIKHAGLKIDKYTACSSTKKNDDACNLPITDPITVQITIPMKYMLSKKMKYLPVAIGRR